MDSPYAGARTGACCDVGRRRSDLAPCADLAPFRNTVVSARLDGVARPLIMAVDPDPEALSRTEGELSRRFGADYTVRAETSARDALRHLERAAETGELVALVLADTWLPEVSGAELLARVRTLHPDAGRGLMVPWGAWGHRETTTEILTAMSRGDINYYVLKPWTTPDELFNKTVSEFVQLWSRSVAGAEREVVVVGEARDRRGHQVRSFLTRNGIPHAFLERGTPAGTEALKHAGVPDPESATGPLTVWMPAIGGAVLHDPTDAELGEAWGLHTTLAPADRDVDLVVIGAGPAGLASAVSGSSEGLSVLCLEHQALGGQAGTSSLIRNYLGFARGLGGTELTQRGFQQAWVFGTSFVITRPVTALQADESGFVVEVEGEGSVRSRAVVLATGVAYRRLPVETLDRLQGTGVYYGANVSEAQGLKGGHTMVVGGGNSAGQAALHLQRYAAHVDIVIRGADLAATMSQYLIDEITSSERITVLADSEVVAASGEDWLESVTLRQRTSGEETVHPVQGLFVMIGAEPHTQWLPEQVTLDKRGFVETGVEHGEDRPHLSYETSIPGLFAVGDVRSGSVKRVAAAVGEGSVVVAQIHQYLALSGPGQR